MDLNLIITHLDNFVDTWKGWGKIVAGINQLERGSLSSTVQDSLRAFYQIDVAVAKAVGGLFSSK